MVSIAQSIVVGEDAQRPQSRGVLVADDMMVGGDAFSGELDPSDRVVALLAPTRVRI